MIMKFNENIQITREENGDYLIEWTEDFTEEPVDIYVSDSPSPIQSGALIHRTDTRSIRIDKLRQNKRHYFHLVPAHSGGVTVGERVLPLRGGTNFRDFGGYLTVDGRQVQWGRLYRSGHLSLLDDGDRIYLSFLDIRKNCDLRRADECSKEPNKLPGTTEIIGLDIDAGSFGSFFHTLQEDQMNPEFMVTIMREINRELVLEHQPKFQKMFAELLDLESGAFLVNCSAGKDRTGFGAALILSSLGVPRETILYDYLLSGHYFPVERERARALEKYGPEMSAIMASEAVMPIAEAREEYLLAAFETIDNTYTSVEQFLEEAYGIGKEERRLLRERLII